MTDCSHKAFGTAHVPCVWVGKYFSDSSDGFTASGGCYDRSDLWGLTGTNDFMDPKHVVSHEVSGFLNGTFVGKGEWFLCG